MWRPDKINDMIQGWSWETVGRLFAEYLVYMRYWQELEQEEKQGQERAAARRGGGFGRYLEESFFD